MLCTGAHISIVHVLLCTGAICAIVHGGHMYYCAWGPYVLLCMGAICAIVHGGHMYYYAWGETEHMFVHMWCLFCVVCPSHQARPPCLNCYPTLLRNKT